MIAPALQAATTIDAARVEPVEVVVTARRRRCDASIAKRIVSDEEFARRVGEWAAGTPIRVVVPKQSDIKCLARITFALADKGVRKVEFVAPGVPRR